MAHLDAGVAVAFARRRRRARADLRSGGARRPPSATLPAPPPPPPRRPPPELGRHFGVRGGRGALRQERIERLQEPAAASSQPKCQRSKAPTSGATPAARQRSPNAAEAYAGRCRVKFRRRAARDAGSRRAARAARCLPTRQGPRRDALRRLKVAGDTHAADGFGAAGFTADGFAVAVGFTIDGFAVAAGLCGTRGFGLACFWHECDASQLFTRPQRVT